MRRIVLILLLVPIFEGNAATPFMSIGVAPTLTNIRYEYGATRVHPYYNSFFSTAGIANVGVKYGVHEWYARYTWFTSDRITETENSTSYYQDYSVTTTQSERTELWQDRRFAMGHRMLIRHAKPDRIDAFIGFALSIGSGIWKKDRVDNSETYYYWSGEYTHDAERSTLTKYSKYSYGGALELGVRYPIYEVIQIEVSGQLGANLTAFNDEETPRNKLQNEAKIFEPSLAMSMRLDIPIVNIEKAPSKR